MMIRPEIIISIGLKMCRPKLHDSGNCVFVFCFVFHRNLTVSNLANGHQTLLQAHPREERVASS